MSTPFQVGTPRKVERPSKRALDMLRGVMMDKAQLKGMNADDASKALDSWLPNLDREQCSFQISAGIDWLKEERARLRREQAASNVERAASAPQRTVDDGFYELPGERIAKVLHAVHGSGRQYAKLLNTDSGGFDYTPRLIDEVRAHGVPLTLERAQQLGKLYGMCCRCGATLTDENSIAAGIGPICASRF